MNGILLVDKPSGMTSHDVVAKIRKCLGTRRVGHAGTLDPLATGLLIVLVGQATKLSNKFLNFDKAYSSTMKLGVTTDTADSDGKIIRTAAFEDITRKKLEDVMAGFEGEQEQLPPMYSAVKVNGRKLYELARRGVEVERQPRKIFIRDLKIENFNAPDVDFYMECSKGTYVRQLAADIGDRLGCGACITRIRRVKVGPFSIEQSVVLSDVQEQHLKNFSA